MKATLLYTTLGLLLGALSPLTLAAEAKRCENCGSSVPTGSKAEVSNTRFKASPQTSSNGRYTVRSGDTLERISRKTGTSVASLSKLNGIRPTTIIHPGRVLKLSADQPKTSLAQAPTAPAPTQGQNRYAIRDGDTYYSISKKTGISVRSLVSLNPSIKPTSLRTGQVIQLRRSEAPSPEPSPTRLAKKDKDKETPAPAPAPATPKPEPTRVATQEPKPSLHPSNSSQLISNTPAPSHPNPQAAEKKPEHPTPAALPKEKAPISPEKAPAPAEKEKAPIGQSSSATPPMGNAKTTVHSIILQEQTTFEQFANSHHISPQELNELNGLSLSNGTVLAKGSELYIPAQP